MALSQSRVRVGGSGFTLFTFMGQPIAFCQQVNHVSPSPVGAGVSAIQPMDEPYPIEIITPAAAGMGQLTLNLFELFGSGGRASAVWDRLGAGNATSFSLPFGPLAQNGLQNISTALPLNGAGPNTPFAGAVDIVDIFIRQAQIDPHKMTITKVIRPLSAGQNAPFYTWEYHGCVITNVQDGEQIDVGTLEVLKNITVAYRYTTRDGHLSQAFAMRDGHLSAPTRTAV